jgi:hypothetical protein
MQIADHHGRFFKLKKLKKTNGIVPCLTRQQNAILKLKIDNFVKYHKLKLQNQKSLKLTFKLTITGT